MKPIRVAFALLLSVAFPAAAQTALPPTPADAQTFLTNAEGRLLQLAVEASRADWAKVNFITEDTELLAAKADERAINAGVELAKQSVRYDGLSLPETLARKMRLLKNGLTLAMLSMGASRPWPEALATVTGQKQMDARVIRDYFAPLQMWLDEQNKGKPVGWQ